MATKSKFCLVLCKGRENTHIFPPSVPQAITRALKKISLDLVQLHQISQNSVPYNLRKQAGKKIKNQIILNHSLCRSHCAGLLFMTPLPSIKRGYKEMWFGGHEERRLGLQVIHYPSKTFSVPTITLRGGSWGGKKLIITQVGLAIQFSNWMIPS